jgi:hypothetical protein
VVFLACLIVEVALVYLDLTVNWLHWSDYSPIRRLFNTTREDALASWFAVTQTVFVALFAWIIHAIGRKQGISGPRLAGWLLVALFFSYMAIDDGAAVHERIGSAFKEREGGSVGFVSYPWQMLLAPVFAAMGLFLLGFLWFELPRATDRVRVFGALTCLAVAMSMDFVEGMEDGYAWFVENYGWKNATIRHFSKSLEEFLEMLGMTLFLVTFLGQVARRGREIVVRFQERI